MNDRLVKLKRLIRLKGFDLDMLVRPIGLNKYNQHAQLVAAQPEEIDVMREEALNSDDPVKTREIWAKIDNKVEVSEGIPLFVKIPVKGKHGPLSIHCIVS